MTLGFSQEIKGVKNFFVPKIWSGLMPTSLSDTELGFVLSDYHLYSKNHLKKFGVNFEIVDVKPKIHTIRAGIGRWRAGLDIHMVINNRTPNRFQFAPTIKCKSVQYIRVLWTDGKPSVYMGERSDLDDLTPFYFVSDDDDDLPGILTYGEDQMNSLAINDGFDSVDDFLAYFNKDFTGTLIHWTDLKY
jgi:hypothetical protein